MRVATRIGAGWGGVGLRLPRRRYIWISTANAGTYWTLTLNYVGRLLFRHW